MSKGQWDLAFENSAYIPDSNKLLEVWTDNAEQYRAAALANGRQLDLDIPYGEHHREFFDLVWPETTPKGLVVFVHGGYWLQFDKSYWTDLAEGVRANGWTVCVPSYTLTPEVRISDITIQVSRAIVTAAKLVTGPIRLAGHSAGGHLVSRMACNDTTLPLEVLERIEHIVSISGLHDLRPLLNTKMNGTLRLDASEAARESTVLHTPVSDTSITAWVGGGERPEFIRQSQLLHIMWQGLDANVNCILDELHNHFSVIEGLKVPSSPITKELLKTLS